jgi:DNA primase
VPYDRFRDRVMFPITDLARPRHRLRRPRAGKGRSGKIPEFAGTPLFHKGDNLYNLATARQATHNGSPLIVVEGYVDVIAMVTAGFGGAVAPLGTALTENQLALLWKMADEPILCFDGDRAGQKAAYRAADLALPNLLPARACALRCCPKGRILMTSRAPAAAPAIEEVIGAARGLADMMWSREIEGGSLCHARAARGARGAHQRTQPTASATRSCAATIAQDLAERLQRAFAPEAARRLRPGRISGRRGESPRAFRPAWPGPAGRFAPAAARPGRAGAAISPGPYQAASPQLATSPIMRGQRSAMSRREALILQSLINHPGSCTTIWRRWRAGTGPSRGHQAPRRYYCGLRQRPSPFPDVRAGRENAGRSRSARIKRGSSKG